MKHYLFSICIVFTLFSCKTTKNTVSQAAEQSIAIPTEVIGCNAIATVKNFTHETGCQYLLELKDGTLLLPGELPETKTPFFEGAGVKIGYTILDKDESVIVETACESHDHVVKVTCIEQFIISEEGMPSKHDECVSIKNPYKFTWMRDGIAKHQPSRVNEYSYSIGYIYEFSTESGSNLYDCLGNFMCNTEDNTDCQSLLETLDSPKVILVVNN